MCRLEGFKFSELMDGSTCKMTSKCLILTQIALQQIRMYLAFPLHFKHTLRTITDILKKKKKQMRTYGVKAHFLFLFTHCVYLLIKILKRAAEPSSLDLTRY